MDIKDTREEIIKRSKIIKEKQRRQVKRALEGTSVGLVALLVMIIRQASFTVEIDNGASYYGTLMLGSEAGVYIIVGMICFILGVIITLITVKYTDKGNVTEDKGELEDK